MNIKQILQTVQTLAHTLTLPTQAHTTLGLVARTGVNLTGAKSNHDTSWPDGFAPVAAAAVLDE